MVSISSSWVIFLVLTLIFLLIAVISFETIRARAPPNEAVYPWWILASYLLAAMFLVLAIIFYVVGYNLKGSCVSSNDDEISKILNCEI
jgi:uncharacterized membrane protein YdcZ (DUF606 family)